MFSGRDFMEKINSVEKEYTDNISAFKNGVILLIILLGLSLFLKDTKVGQLFTIVITLLIIINSIYLVVEKSLYKYKIQSYTIIGIFNVLNKNTLRKNGVSEKFISNLSSHRSKIVGSDDINFQKEEYYKLSVLMDLVTIISEIKFINLNANINQQVNLIYLKELMVEDFSKFINIDISEIEVLDHINREIYNKGGDLEVQELLEKFIKDNFSS